MCHHDVVSQDNRQEGPPSCPGLEWASQENTRAGRKAWSTNPVVQSLSYVQLFATPWTAAHQSPLSFTISRSLLKFMSIESVMPSNHLILCCPLPLLPLILPSIRVFSNESCVITKCGSPA